MTVNRQRNLWRAGFLFVTVGALVMECAAAWDGNPNTDPWTDLITTYIPWQLALAIFGGLAVWVPVHFWVAYRRRMKRQFARVAAEQAERTKHEATLPFTYDEHGHRVWREGIPPSERY